MAVAELTGGLSAAAAAEDGAEGVGDELDVRVDVHDATRIEWSVSVPLPEKHRFAYGIDVELEIPANVFAQHSAWDQLQSWTRLDGPAKAVAPGQAVTIDALRRATIAYAHRLARASEAFSRHCRLAGGLSAEAPLDDVVDGLNLWIGVARATTEEARDRLVTSAGNDSAELRRERELVDEYLSVRLLEMLAGAERALKSLETSRHAEAYRPATTAAETALAEALESEVAHRRAAGYLCAEPTSQATLERYLDRASRLKKHFQEVLFLEPEAFKVDERIHHWVAAFVAILASTWAFAWQIALMNRQPSTGTTVGSGLIMLAAIAGVVYAAKDRIKELGRTWIAGHVHRFYAQRVARWRAPARRLPGRDVVVKARESFDQAIVSRPDPLNPFSGASMTSTIVRYHHKGHVMPTPELLKSGVRRVKHIFRYDLSPLFARLDDAVKKVPVLDVHTRRVSFIDAPRCYRVPIRLVVKGSGADRETKATLVLHKRGLERIEFDGSSEHGLDTGLL